MAKINIAGELDCKTTEGKLVDASQVKDGARENKSQAQINTELEEKIAESVLPYISNTTSSNSVIIDISSGSGSKSTTIPAATTETAGVMCAEDKVAINRLGKRSIQFCADEDVNTYIKEIYISGEGATDMEFYISRLERAEDNYCNCTIRSKDDDLTFTFSKNTGEIRYGYAKINKEGFTVEVIINYEKIAGKHTLKAESGKLLPSCYDIAYSPYIKALHNEEYTESELDETLQNIQQIEKRVDDITVRVNDVRVDDIPVCIVGAGATPEDAGVSNVGDVYIHTAYNQPAKLRKCIAQDEYKEIQFVKNCIYLWDNQSYIWNGETLVYISDNAVDFETKNGSIKTDGTVNADSANYNYSSPIFLKSGAKIITRLMGDAVTILAETDAEGSIYTPLIKVQGEHSYDKEYSYTASRDMYVALCWRITGLPLPLCTRIIIDTNMPTPTAKVEVSTVEIPMQGGRLKTSDGLFNVAYSDRSIYMNSIHSVYYYSGTFDDVELNEGETLRIHCYKNDYTYIGYKSSCKNLFPETQYIKIEVSKGEEYEVLRNVKCSVIGAITSTLNSTNENSYVHFSFEIQAPLIEQENSDINSHCINKRHYDNGFVILPPNYDPKGVPVPLIIFWHGTDGFNFKNSYKSYEEQLKFLSYNGYAVADCSGMSDKYQIGDEAVSGRNCRMNPMAISCFKGLYDFISANYNIKRDGAYVFGKSNGALGTVMLGYTQPFPIKALASLAGSLSLVASFRFSSAENLNYWLKQFGIETNYDFEGYLYQNQTEEMVETIASAADRYANFDPMIIGTDIDAQEFARKIFDNNYNNHSMDNDTLWSVVNSTKKYLPKPIKIWHAIDDKAVPIETSRFFKTMVDKLHGVCYLREFPADCGGHNAVDTSDKAPKTTYTTKYKGDVEIVVAYAELVEWFNQW